MLKSKDSSAENAGEGLTAGLAKGLRMFNGPNDLSEEGMGFGVPVIVNRYRTYLSYSARETESGKVFLMDATQTVRGKKAAGVLPYLWLETKGRLYKTFPSVQRFMLSRRATGNLTPDIGFTPCESQCEIPVRYEIEGAGVRITADLSGLSFLQGSPKVFMLNEQGGRGFPLYKEQGEAGEESVGWKKVEAAEAAFLNADASAGFSLSQTEGATLFKGREVSGDILSWSGLDFDVTRAIGETFAYRVEIDPKPIGVTLK